MIETFKQMVGLKLKPKPDYILIAEKEIGVAEVPGKGSNPRILDYHKATKLKATDDAVSWCSSYVNWVLQKAGYKSTHSAAARSWLQSDVGVPLKKFEPYCVCVFARGNSAWQGHVGFGVEDLGDRIRVLGGNQSDKVGYVFMPKSKLLGMLRPVKQS